MLASASELDLLLLPFLSATDERAEATLLSALVTEQIDPVVRRVLAHKLQLYLQQGSARAGNPDTEELYNDIQLFLLRRLRDLKENPSEHPIRNLRSYVATTARHLCDEYLRRKYPRRRHLKDKIRYYLTTQPEFVLWEDDERGWLSGLTARAYQTESLDVISSAQTLQALPELLESRLSDVDLRRLNLRELLRALFEASAQPLELDQLTTIIARLWGVEDHPAESLDEMEQPLSERLASPQVNPDTVIEYQQLLKHLWAEICLLPRRQRVALLLNLKNPNGINVITLLPATRVATFRQIAEALEIPVEQFERFWTNLPMDDLSIAQYLGATRQQVINLRKNARDRLARRMKRGQFGGL